MSGIDQSVFLYVDESIKQCKELASFIKKRQQAEIDYAKAILKITGNFQKTSGGGKGPMSALNMGLQQTASMIAPPPQYSEIAKAMLQKSCVLTYIAFFTKLMAFFRSVWRIFNEIIAEAESTAAAQLQKAKCMNQDVLIPFIAYIKEMEAIRREHVESVQEYTKSVEEVCNCLKKAKKDMEQLQAQTADFSSNYSKAQQNSGIKERDLEKLSQKVNASVEKTLKAQETAKMYKELCNEAQTEYFGVLLPKLCEDILIKEEERSVAALRVMTDYLYVDNLHQKTVSESINAILGNAASVEISVDSKEIVDKLIRKEVIHRHQMNADQHSNSICMGYMLVKRGYVVNEWTAQFCVFTFDKHLDFYDPNQMERPHSSISLRESSVIELHPTLFGAKYCFQISHFSLQTGKELITLSFETEPEKDQWLSQLRLYAYCCRKCARVHGYNSEMECNTVLAEKDHGCRVVRSLEVNVIEAKDLVVDDFGQKVSTPYCIIQLGDLRVAKTKVKEGESPFWGEDEIRPHVDCIKIHVSNSNRLQRPMDIGYIEIPLESLKTGGKKTEEWYPIKHSKEDPNHHRGSIRICVKYHIDQVLPRHEYTSFLNFLTEPHFKAMNVLGGVAPSSMRAQFAKTVVRLLISKKLEVEGLVSFIENEINATNDPHIIFRGNSLGTKAMDILMSAIGMDYLHTTLGSLIKVIYESKESCEVDPLRVESPEALKKNMKRLLDYVQVVWNAILDSADKCPQLSLSCSFIVLRIYVETFARSFVSIFTAIQNAIQVKWGENLNVKYSAISGFIFLRFFCPAILSPNLFELIDDFPDANRARTFTLLAKIIQTLANLTEFGQKEQYLAELSSSNFNNNSDIIARIDLRRETEAFYQLCLQLIKEIEAMRDKNKTTSSNTYIAERLLSEFKKLSNSHELAKAAQPGSARGSRVSGTSSSGGAKRSGRRASASGVPISLPRKGSGVAAHAVVSKAAVRFGDDYDAQTSAVSGEGMRSSDGSPASSQRSSVGAESSAYVSPANSFAAAALPSPAIYADIEVAVKISNAIKANSSASVNPDLSVSASASTSANVSRPGSPGLALRANILRGLGKSGDDIDSGSRESMSGDVVGNLEERRLSLWGALKSINNPTHGSSSAIEKINSAGSTTSLTPGPTTLNPLKSFLGIFSTKRNTSISAPVDEVNPEDGLAYIQAKGFDRFKDLDLQQTASDNWEEKSTKSVDSFGDRLVEPSSSGHSLANASHLHPELGSLQSVQQSSLIPRSPLHRQNSAGKGALKGRFSVDFLGKLTGGHGSQSDMSGIGGEKTPPKKSYSTHQ
ncbi:UNVERIFIED_CONTAM: Ras GTPase-activating protein 1 [Siphonaria sp. JEL0065]|nr:Ras GTPase-activating protein 1 [Siphonaria sp. JEL0065]